jgi:hypothetical protein
VLVLEAVVEAVSVAAVAHIVAVAAVRIVVVDTATVVVVVAEAPAVASWPLVGNRKAFLLHPHQLLGWCWVAEEEKSCRVTIVVGTAGFRIAMAVVAVVVAESAQNE